MKNSLPKADDFIKYKNYESTLKRVVDDYYAAIKQNSNVYNLKIKELQDKISDHTDSILNMTKQLLPDE